MISYVFQCMRLHLRNKDRFPDSHARAAGSNMDHGTYRAVSDGYTMYLITGEGESMKRLAVLILSGIMAAGGFDRGVP